ncbi:hypothetical protein B0I35DRAFT_434180 [Stachybotrys elegans]|uniref:Azaphilone pigments biosynthesis cluster protein L N-terminal domain-containing protein n=1 Tax=Stachybotrys elegans TaxID=80388 RepID=A0A8K0SKP5_9HYPO|nr:hypothetical protein B0I35DRAFT_434180 [Stachybotrys elegans]
MEALGAGASVVAFVPLAMGAAKVAYNILSSIKDGPSSVQKAAEAILTLYGILEQLDRLDQSDTDVPLRVDIKGCFEDLDVFAKKVIKVQSSSIDDGGRRLWKRLKQFVTEKELEKISLSISQHYSRLNVRLGALSTNKLSILNNNMSRFGSELQMVATAQQRQTSLVVDSNLDLRNALTGKLDAQTSLLRDFYPRLCASQATNDARLTQLRASFDELKADTASSIDKVAGSVASINTGLAANEAQELQEVLSNFGRDAKALSQQLNNFSRIIGEIPSHQSGTLGDSATFAQDEAYDLTDRRLADAIQRLSRLTQDKERTFDLMESADRTSQSIIDDLKSILDTARHKANEIATSYSSTISQDCKSEHAELDLQIGQFSNIFAGNDLVLNPHGGTVNRKRKMPLTILETSGSSQSISFSSGVLTFTRRKRLRKCSCNGEACHDCTSMRHLCDQASPTYTEYLGVVTFVPRDNRKHSMFTISAFNLRAAQIGFSSMSSLSVNRVIPSGSKVFSLVEEGLLQELREMLQDGEASLRDHDEGGASLLFYSTQQPQMCKFLVENGLDVNHVAKYDYFKRTPIQIEMNDFDRDLAEVSVRDECREILLNAGADMLWSPEPDHICGPFIDSLADDNAFGNYTRHVKKALSEGLLTLSDIQSYRTRGNSLLHIACGNYAIGVTQQTILDLLAFGIDINEVGARGERCLFTAISSFGMLRGPESDGSHHVIREQQVLVTLLHNGANPRDEFQGLSMSEYAYHPHLCNRRYEDGAFGSYLGDLWDSALSICDYEISEFRRNFPRRAHYTAKYAREDFELLWKGREKLCPYWYNTPYPSNSEMESDNEPQSEDESDSGGAGSCPEPQSEDDSDGDGVGSDPETQSEDESDDGRCIL